MKIKFILLVLLLFILSSNSQAQMRDYVVKGGIQIDERLIFGEFNDYKFSFLVRGYVNLRFNKMLSGEFGIGLGRLSGTDVMHNPFPNEWKTNITTVDARLRIAPFTKIPYMNPYLYVGGGILRYEVSGLHGTISPDPIEQDNVTGMVLAGIGTEVVLFKNLLLDVSSGFAYTFTDNLNYYSIDVYDDAIGNFAIGLTYTGQSDKTDYDKDNLQKYYEEKIGTDPDKPDTDLDGLKDGEEVNIYNSDPLNQDTDGDGLSDYYEVIIYKTNPVNPDTDNDGLKDIVEIFELSTNPILADTDNDGLIDGEETNNIKSDPLNADTDSDGFSDGDEITLYMSNPLKADSDNGSIKEGNGNISGTKLLDPKDDLVKYKIGSIIILNGINFEYKNVEPTPESDEILKEALKLYKDNQENQ